MEVHSKSISARVTPVILCGGSGTRLWPLSRSESPKQFQNLVGSESLFQQTLRRFTGPPFGQPLIMVGQNLVSLAQSQTMLPELEEPCFIVEPVARGTAAAIAAAALHLQQTEGEQLMLVTPSDHLIDDPKAFSDAVNASSEAARNGKIVTFGIRPKSPHTGYGYIRTKENIDGSPVAIEGFIEKPDRAHAEQLLEEDNVFWNSGVFLFSATTILTELEKFEPQIVECTAQALGADGVKNGRVVLDELLFNQCPNTSIDLAVMERSDRIVVLPVDTKWSDVGGWSALFDLSDKDDNGNVVEGDAELYGSTGCLVRSDAGRLVSVVGLDDIVVVDTPDAVLLSSLVQSENVKLIAERITLNGRTEAVTPKLVHRPWGSYQSVAEGDGFQVKRIVVKPGEVLSLQYHHHRSEHWTVVQGTAEVTVGDTVTTLSENESVYIDKVEVHRLGNPGRVDMHLIEVQCGTYLGEDDIVRIEDTYGRVE